MKKQKLSLNNLEVKSFVTNLNSESIKTIQAGFAIAYDSSGATGSPGCTVVSLPNYCPPLHTDFCPLPISNWC